MLCQHGGLNGLTVFKRKSRKNEGNKGCQFEKKKKKISPVVGF
jgi:hypothetical protein